MKILIRPPWGVARSNEATPVRPLVRQESGRVRDGENRDMNPGTLVAITSNMLGQKKTVLVEDRSIHVDWPGAIVLR